MRVFLFKVVGIEVEIKKGNETDVIQRIPSLSP